MSKKVIVVGGVAGGATAVARLRRVDDHAEIIMMEKGEFISFANCGLPYYVGGTIEDRESLLVQTPEAMESRFNVSVRTFNEVTRIDREQKLVEVKNLKTGDSYEESYDTLLLSPGSVPLKPPIPGIDAPNIFTLWTIPDVDQIKSYVMENDIKEVAVIGGGFIGIEMAENFRELGINVTIVEMLDQVMAPIDFDMAQIVHQHLKDHGVNLVLGDGVDHFENEGKQTAVVLKSGNKVKADMVMLSIGVRPQTELAKAAGLEVGPRGHIVVDDYMMTSDENIYAIGDAIEVVDYITKTKTAVPLAGPANKQGRIAANNILGDKKEKYKGTQGTSIAKVFDISVASTGHNEKMLKRNGLELRKDYLKMVLHPKHHVDYYPGAEAMTLKVLFDKAGKILGAQGIGGEGVDKRIDIIATAIRFGATVYDLKELELAYAPPYNGAKDPVNFVGFFGENILEGMIDLVFADEVMDQDMENTIFLDVRGPEEVAARGKIAGSVNIPLGVLRDRLGELDASKKIIVYCIMGVSGYVASRILMQNGFNQVYNLAGGYQSYSIEFCQEGSDLSSCGGRVYEKAEFTEAGEAE